MSVLLLGVTSGCFLIFVFYHLIGRDLPSWAVFWLCLPVQAIRTGLSRLGLLHLVGTNTLHTGTVHHGGKREMDAYPIQAAFTLFTGAAKVRLKVSNIVQGNEDTVKVIKPNQTAVHFMYALHVLRCVSTADRGGQDDP